MPMLILRTNISKLPTGFFTKAAKLLGDMTNRPASAVMCVAETGQAMYFGGSEAPTTLMSVYSIGKFNPVSNKIYTAKLSDFISEELGIDKERILIKFQDLQASNIGWNGTTREAAAREAAEA